MYYKDEGIILNYHDWHSSDRIVVIFLKKYGKMNFVFKGVKKSKSKKLNTADIGNYVELFYYRKHADQLPYIREINVKNHFYQAKKNHIKFLYLHFISELLLNLLPQEEANIKLFNFFLKVLLILQRISESELEKFIIYVEYRLIQVSGILPDFQTCSHCHLKKDKLIYEYDSNVMICDNCGLKHSSQNIIIDKKIMDNITNINKHNITEIESLKLSSNNIKSMDKIFKNIIYKYLNKELKSYKILQKIMEDIKGL